MYLTLYYTSAKEDNGASEEILVNYQVNSDDIKKVNRTKKNKWQNSIHSATKMSRKIKILKWWLVSGQQSTNLCLKTLTC